MVDRLSETAGSPEPGFPDPNNGGQADKRPLTNQVALSYLAPPDDLASLFGPLYLFIADKADVADHTRADFAQIRFMLAGEGDYAFHDGRRIATPGCCMLGPTTAATRFQVVGPMRVVGIAVLPLGWSALRAGDASIVADDLFDLAERFGPAWARLQAQLVAVEDVEEVAALVWPFLREHVRLPSADEVAFINAVDAWLTDERSPRVEVLQEATDLSGRQVARLCNRFYGSPPKFLARKYRALRCALILARDNVDWQDLCDGAFTTSRTSSASSSISSA